MTVTLSDLQARGDDFKENIDAHRQSIDDALSGVDLSQFDTEFNSTTDARVIGAYGGVAPGLVFGGAEVQILYAYDQVTGDTGVYVYTGGTAGISVGVPIAGDVIGGYFLFDGDLDDLTGMSYGVQSSTGVALGYSRTPSGKSMVQIGGEIGAAAELTLGVTIDVTDHYNVDWALTERTLQQKFANDEAMLARVLEEMAIAREIPAYEADFIEKYSIYVQLEEGCFLAGTQISMWPTDAGLKPNANGVYDEDAVRAKLWYKPIEEIRTGDIVVSHDKNGHMQPGTVGPTFVNQSSHILDFWGTKVTPGHAYYCAGGKFEGQHVPLIDILRTDGVVKHQDGTLIRAATNCEVGSLDDQMVQVAFFEDAEARAANRFETKPLRLGTKFLQEDGTTISLRMMIEAGGFEITGNGLLRNKDGQEAPATLLDRAFPNPEDYILARSKLTLNAIYSTPWESQHPPRLPPPYAGEAGPAFTPNRKPVLTASSSQAMPRRAPTPASRLAAASPAKAPQKLNRKQRKALEAKQRKASKTRKRVTG